MRKMMDEREPVKIAPGEIADREKGGARPRGRGGIEKHGRAPRLTEGPRFRLARLPDGRVGFRVQHVSRSCFRPIGSRAKRTEKFETCYRIISNFSQGRLQAGQRSASGLSEV
jgi:hypothetical protein